MRRVTKPRGVARLDSQTSVGNPRRQVFRGREKSRYSDPLDTVTLLDLWQLNDEPDAERRGQRCRQPSTGSRRWWSQEATCSAFIILKQMVVKMICEFRVKWGSLEKSSKSEIKGFQNHPFTYITFSAQRQMALHLNHCSSYSALLAHQQYIGSNGVNTFLIFPRTKWRHIKPYILK